MQLNKVEIFEVGDKVRILMSSLYAKVRKLIKSDLQKLLPVKYTPNIYVIEKVKKPRGQKKELIKDKYILSLKGKTLLDDKGKVKLFYGSELQRVNNETNEKRISQNDALRLNMMKNEIFFDENDNIDEKKVEEVTKPPKQKENAIGEPRRSGREKKQRDILDL